MAITIKKKELISVIQSTLSFSNPKIGLEQYCIDAISAVDIIYFAGFEFDDITHNIIVDLGTGTGRLAITSAFFQPSKIIAVDIDLPALRILKQNLELLELQEMISPICMDVRNFQIISELVLEHKITTIMNPPFGVQRKKADRIFLMNAFSYSDVIYSIHLLHEEVDDFILKFVKRNQWQVSFSYPFRMILERSFPFHSKKTKEIDVRIYRFVKSL